MCKDWCDRDIRVRALTGHSDHCTKSGKPFDAACNLIADLVIGIELWAGDCEGVPDWMWDDYLTAKSLGLEKVENDNQ
jgi:hypothetical protein